MATKNEPVQPSAIQPVQTTVEMTEALADAIQRVDAAMKTIVAGGLSRRAIALLVADNAGIGITQVYAVLNSMETLKRKYLPKR